VIETGAHIRLKERTNFDCKSQKKDAKNHFVTDSHFSLTRKYSFTYLSLNVNLLPLKLHSLPNTTALHHQIRGVLTLIAPSIGHPEGPFPVKISNLLKNARPRNKIIFIIISSLFSLLGLAKAQRLADSNPHKHLLPSLSLKTRNTNKNPNENFGLSLSLSLSLCVCLTVSVSLPDHSSVDKTGFPPFGETPY